MSVKINAPTDQNSFLAGIGHICLQWALLEQTLLAIIAAAEDAPFERIYTRFGGLGMRPRLNMAIKLTREAKWPKRLTKPLVDIRRVLQREGEDIAERRNLFVHGVHKDTDVPGETCLTMARWSHDKRDQVVTLVEAVQLANRIAQLVQEAEGIFRGYGLWKFGAGSENHGSRYGAQRKTTARLIRAHNIRRALKLLMDNLKPW